MVKEVVKRIPGARWAARKLGINSSREFLVEILPKEAVGAEIGVHLGNFSERLLRTTRPKELHLIDPWEYHAGPVYKTAWYGGGAENEQAELDERDATVIDRFKKGVRSGQVQIHRGYSEPVLQGFPDAYFDWVYIDGNHTYEYVKRDIELSIQKVKPGGYVTGDDYCEDGWWGGGVKKAVDELANSKILQLIELRNRQFIFRINSPA